MGKAAANNVGDCSQLLDTARRLGSHGHYMTPCPERAATSASDRPSLST